MGKMGNNYAKKIDIHIEKYFPKKWTREDIEFFLGDLVYEIDLDAVNSSLNEPLKDFIERGGKRLRPALFLTCLEIFGVDHTKHLDLALLIELVHNGTLVLDDIEDEGLLRRNKPTLHEKYGLDTATNCGFVLHVLPLKFLVKKQKDLSISKLNKLWNLYYESMVNVGFGQSIDIYWHKHINGDLSLENYLEMVRLKTGSLMRMSIGMACVVAGINKRTEEAFKKFAEELGLAFQIIDDTLDIARSDTKFGKAYGNDITEGKVSLPIVYAMRNVNNKDKLKLVSILARHTRNKKDITKALNIIKKSGAIDMSMEHARKIIDKAWYKIDSEQSDKYKLLKLKELAYFFVHRNY